MDLHLTKTHKGLDIGLRPATLDDVPFILNSCIKSGILKQEYKSHCLCNVMPRNILIQAIHGYLESLLEQSRIIICCDPESPEMIWGYVWLVDDKVLYIYTKDAHRSMGIAFHLLSIVSPQAAPSIHKILTPAGMKLLNYYNNQLTT